MAVYDADVQDTMDAFRGAAEEQARYDVIVDGMLHPTDDSQEPAPIHIPSLLASVSPEEALAAMTSSGDLTLTERESQAALSTENVGEEVLPVPALQLGRRPSATNLESKRGKLTREPSVTKRRKATPTGDQIRSAKNDWSARNVRRVRRLLLPLYAVPCAVPLAAPLLLSAKEQSVELCTLFQLFALFDVDKNGFLDATEFASCLSALGVKLGAAESVRALYTSLAKKSGEAFVSVTGVTSLVV